MQSLYTALTFLGFMGCIWSEASVILNLRCSLLQGHAWLNNLKNAQQPMQQNLYANQQQGFY